MKDPRLPAALVALAACGAPGQRAPAPGPRPPAIVSASTAEETLPASLNPTEVECALRMPAPRRVDLENRWFVFTGAPYPQDRRDWRIETPGLPAISKDGARVLLEGWEELTDDSPHLTLQVLRASDAAVLETRKLLPYDEMEAAYHHSPSPACAGCTWVDEEPTREAFAKLRATWGERLKAFATQLDAEGWQPLEKCLLGDGTAGRWMCNAATHEARCGPGVAVAYTEPTLTLAVRGGGTATLSRASWRSPPKPDQRVKGCFGEVAFDPARRLLVARIDRICQLSGDSCVVPSVFATARLPGAPAPASAAVVASCPSGMVSVPAGHVYGAASEPGCASLAPHDPAVGALCVDDAPLTVDAYRRCVSARGCFAPTGACAIAAKQGGADQMICDRVEERAAYCAWVGKRSLTRDEVAYLGRLGQPGGADGRGFRCALGRRP